MKIAITINEVLRDYIGQFTATYEKYVGETDIVEGDVTSLDLMDFYEFDDIDTLNKFLYIEAPYEIFGAADQMSSTVITHLNNFIMDIKDEEEHEIEIVSREIDKSIPSTFFFLSKTGVKINNVRFVSNYEEKWNGVDVLITANPKALESKPNGKISVKVRASYNEDVKADYEVDSLVDLMKDEELMDTILNTKITTYEEIK